MTRLLRAGRTTREPLPRWPVRVSRHRARSWTLRPYRNDMALGPVSPKEFVERVDFLVRNDDGSTPDPPAARLLQKPRLPDRLGFLSDPFPGFLPTDLSEQPNPVPAAQSIRRI